VGLSFECGVPRLLPDPDESDMGVTNDYHPRLRPEGPPR
jgi:hypothetical protein